MTTKSKYLFIASMDVDPAKSWACSTRRTTPSTALNCHKFRESAR